MQKKRLFRDLWSIIAWIATELHAFCQRNWRCANNGAETPDDAILGISHVENRFQHSILYGKSHDIRWSEENGGMSGDPTGGPLGIFWTSTPSDSLQMEHVSQEKYIILVSFQNWHWQNNLNPRHILFSHKNWSGWKFFFFKVFFTIVDLGKSKHSELIGPHF